MDALTHRLAKALVEAYSYALEGSTPLVDSTRNYVCDLSREALSSFNFRRSGEGETPYAHTPAPWHNPCGEAIFSSDGKVCIGETQYGPIGGINHAKDRAEARANARRIVACVNVLAGLSTEVLESGTREEIAAELLALSTGADQVRA